LFCHQYLILIESKRAFEALSIVPGIDLIEHRIVIKTSCARLKNKEIIEDRPS
jgi:hypothetical protein